MADGLKQCEHCGAFPGYDGGSAPVAHSCPCGPTPDGLFRCWCGVLRMSKAMEGALLRLVSGADRGEVEAEVLRQLKAAKRAGT